MTGIRPGRTVSRTVRNVGATVLAVVLVAMLAVVAPPATDSTTSAPTMTYPAAATQSDVTAMPAAQVQASDSGCDESVTNLHGFVDVPVDAVAHSV